MSPRVIAVSSTDDAGLGSEVSGHFGRCPFFTLVRVEGVEVLEVDIVPNPHYAGHRPGQVPEFVHGLHADVILAGGMGQRAVQLFQGYGIDVATGARGSVEHAVHAFLDGSLHGQEACRQSHEHGHGDGHGHGMAR